MALTLAEIAELKRLRDQARRKQSASTAQVVGRRSTSSAVAANPAPETGDSALFGTLKDDVMSFISRQTELMFNEMDFQMQLALFLRATGHYSDVDVEYFLPTRNTDILEGYEWDSNMRTDIVVSHDGEYIPVELKYTTRLVRRDTMRFGIMVKDLEVMRNQGAQDNIRYNFWKDVRRVELIKKIFPTVDHGLAVFLTCDPAYTKAPRSDSSCAPFSMAGDHPIGGGEMDWIGNPASRKDHMPFHLDGRYLIEWRHTTIDNIDFHYTIVSI